MCKLSNTSIIRNDLCAKCEMMNTFLFTQGIKKKGLGQGGRREGGERLRIEHRKLSLRRKHCAYYFGVKEVSCRESVTKGRC